MPATHLKKQPIENEFQSHTSLGIKLQNILLATDFSASANLALPFAGGMAQCFGAKLYAVHVEEPINYALPAESWQREAATREIELQALPGSIQHEFNILTEVGRPAVPVSFAV